MAKILQIAKSIISYFEDSNVPFIYVLLSFLFAVTLRIFFEAFSNNSDVLVETFAHYYLLYTSLALDFVLLFYLIAKVEILKLIRLIFPMFILLLIAPIMDLILSFGKGYKMTYLIPEIHQDLLIRYFTFFGGMADPVKLSEFTHIGVTPGMKIEIALVLFGASLYIYLKTKDKLKSLIGAILLYTILFIGASAPFGVKIVSDFFSFTPTYSEKIFFNIYLLTSLIVGLTLAYLVNKKYFAILFRDIRPLRIAHFELMFVLGIVLGMPWIKLSITAENIFYFLFIPISLVFAGLFSLMTNNIEDVEIDRISNKTRPLITGEISPDLYRIIAGVFLIISLSFAAAVSVITFYFVLLGIGNYFLYSMRPLRLKRIPIVSKMMIALNSLIAVFLGFLLMTEGSLENFPMIYIFIFLFGFGLAINFIDIKDYKGDKKLGIQTLPVIMGLKRSKQLIGLFFIDAYLLTFFVVGELFALVPLLLIGITQYYLINKKLYKEKHVFGVYLFSIVVGILYLIGANNGVVPVAFK